MYKPEMSKPLKILVINLMHIGDLLLVTPVLRTLRTNYPEAHLALLADEKLQDLVKYNENINELLVIDKKGYHNKLATYLQFVRGIREQKFDIVINLHANERASFIAAFSGAKKIVGYATFGLGPFFDQVIENRKAIKHQVHAHFDVLRETLGITKFDDRGIEMWLDNQAEENANRVWSKAFPDEKIKVIGLNIGASWETKRWRKEHYAQLADELLAKGYGVVYYGGPMDVDIVQETIGLMHHKENEGLVALTGKMTLLELAALLKKCKVLVTNDTGPMHVAVAMNVPLVSMFGPSPVPGFYPYSETSVVIKSPMHCHPCGKHQCPTKHECMWQIGVDMVMKYTMEQLENPKLYEKGSYVMPS